jgi:hypothetical protein
MSRWIAKRPVLVHLADGGDRVLLKATTVLRDADSPTQDRANFFVEATGQRCWMDSGYFEHNFGRANYG